MKVLVTGGAGYIGSHTCIELLNSGYEVVVVDNLSNSSKKSLTRVKMITGKSLFFYEGDVRDKYVLRRIFDNHKIDCVIHFAGLKAVGESVSKPLEYYDNNINSTLILLDEMRKYGIKKFIFSSSATVYTAGSSEPFCETDPVGNCTNPYGWTKYMIERILEGLYISDPEWSITMLRYFNPIGAHSSGMIGEDPKGIPNNLMPYITQVAVGRREYLSVFGNDYNTPDGIGVRDYIHVVDLAKGHVAAIKYVMSNTGCEAINLGTGKGYSVLDVVHSFINATDIPIPYKFSSRRPGDIAVCYSNPNKAYLVLGWRAELSLDDMCRDSWNWQSKNPNGYE